MSDGHFLKMASRSCVSECGHFLASSDVTVDVPQTWAISMLRQRLWMSHVLIAGTRLLRCCDLDTSSPNEGVSPLPCPVLAPPGFGGLPRLMVRVT